MMTDLEADFTNDIENLLSNPYGLEEVRAAADEITEEKIRDYVSPVTTRRMWSSNADSILATMVENLPQRKIWQRPPLSLVQWA